VKWDLLFGCCPEAAASLILEVKDAAAFCCPEPDQLRLAIAAFREDERIRRDVDPTARPLVCVQAALNYFNAEHNVLTRMFAVEYSHWFDSMLPGMEGTGIPLPLGGTSNHFRSARQRAGIPCGDHRLDDLGGSLFQGSGVDQAAHPVDQGLHDHGRR